MIRSGIAAGLVALVCVAQPLRGQTPASDGCTSVLLEPEHWAVQATYRLEAMAGSTGPVSRTPTVCAVRAIFLARAGDLPIAKDWLERLDREYAGPAESGVGIAGARAELIGTIAREETAPGLGEYEGRTGALPVPDISRLDGGAKASLTSADRFSATLGVQSNTRAPHLARLEGSVRFGGLVATAGRGPTGLGYSPRASIVLHAIPSFDRLQLQTENGFQLKGALGVIGTIGFEGFVGRLDEDRHQREPYFWGGVLSVRPHRRLLVSINRAAMFGGDGYEVTAGDLLNMLIGRVAGIGFENQVVSVSARWRLPTDQVLPVTLYMDWGAEDAAGAWTHVPGQMFGAYFPQLPKLPSTSLALEVARFAESCCFNPEWYRHSAFPGSWASLDEPLGHPLGGHGREIAMIVDSYFADGRVHTQTDLYARDRFSENLYVPGRGGRSVGGELNLQYDLNGRMRIGTAVELESGSDWTERRAQATLSIFP